MRLRSSPRSARLHAIARAALLAGLGISLLAPVAEAKGGSGRKASPTASHSKRRAATRSTARKRTATKRTTTKKSAASSHRVAEAQRRAAELAAAESYLEAPLPVVEVPSVDSVTPQGGLAFGKSVTMASAIGPESNRPFAALSASATSLLDRMVERARSQLGTRYVLGGARPGEALDCSSFARFVMQAIGMQLPRTAAQQARVGQAVPRDREHLRPGDLLTFGQGRSVSHVGIYLGEGRFIHASVKSGKVIETTFDRNGLLLRRWKGARRLFAAGDSAGARTQGG